MEVRRGLGRPCSLEEEEPQELVQAAELDRRRVMSYCAFAAQNELREGAEAVVSCGMNIGNVQHVYVSRFGGERWSAGMSAG